MNATSATSPGPCRRSASTHPPNGLAFQRPSPGARTTSTICSSPSGATCSAPPRGHDIIRVLLDGSGTKVESQEVFLVGPVPLDLTFDAAGAMYIADFGGSILKVDRVP